ncbi:hypothetical protein P170DRAFT_430761 [Aspergillus steynii IBT 23096]|uniref:Uncharacterized protein n=1 Tax=Aspergillus steynii IBT 23096 TaxID=1392250 RepID=A0A2I2FSW7_9EURO|nr:uncharacterized protein P170DRAFT_430761 [Aspergillus steynii IBT 23096]PLB43730.1 hypothetical protein P170DRAFT_430761 [Aspergillus steynii IBT 23096]
MAPGSYLESVTGPRSQTKCRLELLPTELRIAILFSCPDLDTLRLLVHASPVYHRAYRRVRQEALLHTLHAEYDGLVEITDAIVAVRSRGLYAVVPSNKEKIYSLLDQWRRHEEIRRLDLPSARDLPDKPAGFDEIIRLVRLHKIMKFCLNDFCNTANCPEWIEPARWKTDMLPFSLSRTEKTRFFRALYRVQIYGNIFGHNEFCVDEKLPLRYRYNSWADETFSIDEGCRVFFGTMTPWEFQEFGSAWKYIKGRYAQPYEEVAALFRGFELLPMDQFLDKTDPPLPINCAVLDTHDLDRYRDETQACLATMGPAFFYKFTRKPDIVHRRDLILVNAWHSWTYFPEMLRWTDHIFPLFYPVEHFEAWEDWSESRSQWARLPPSQRPNIACDVTWFTESTNRRISRPLYAWLVREKYWEWAYAIWDDERLIGWRIPLHKLRSSSRD